MVDYTKPQDDEIIVVNNTNYSLRKILEECAGKLYCKSSDKVKKIIKLKVRIDLLTMGNEF